MTHTLHGHRVHFRRLRHVALDEQERAYLRKLIEWAAYEPDHDAPVHIAKLKEKLS